MKDLFQNKFPVDEEKAIPGKNVLKIDKKWFPLPGKLVSTNRNAGLL